jgi:DMSO reductase family type II enzyme heme b subunit
LWQQATALQVPLSAQTVTMPILRETRVKSVSARALHNGAQIAFLIEWDDETQNDQMVRIQDFRDAVALQFPQVQGQPFFCMGMQGGNVNIWHWKADWQADIAAWQDMESQYPNMNVDQYPFAQGDMPSPADYEDVNYCLRWLR